MNFDESVKYLYGLGNEVLAMKLGLENIGKLLKALGDPQNNYLKVQIAGTNGKGSTCAFLESICVEAGIKVGATNSPHLVSVTERIKIGGVDIGEEYFANHATKIRDVSEWLVTTGFLETVPTFFEQVTAIAFQAFADSGVELAILETGLGGRFDATTAANAGIAAITPIDYDHQRILGSTLAAIASEKAAIIRRGSVVVLSRQPQEALDVIMARCAEVGVVPICTSEVSASGTGRISDLRSQISDLQSLRSTYKDVKVGLPGIHQIENAKAAILLAEILQQTFEITAEDIVSGLQNTKHRGRLEFWRNFLFDGAHNAGGAKALREFLDEYIDRPITMIYGSMRDKDLGEIAASLGPKAEKLILTRADNQRSMNTSELAEYFPATRFGGTLYLTETVEEALKTAQEVSSEGDLILITGSLYLIGEAQKLLKDQSEI